MVTLQVKQKHFPPLALATGQAHHPRTKRKVCPHATMVQGGSRRGSTNPDVRIYFSTENADRAAAKEYLCVGSFLALHRGRVAPLWDTGLSFFAHFAE